MTCTEAVDCRDKQLKNVLRNFDTRNLGPRDKFVVNKTSKCEEL